MRFEALVMVTQRVNFIRTVLGLTEHEDTVRMYMKRVCEHHHLKLQPARGPGYDGRHLRFANNPQRYHCSLLLGWLLQSSDGGIARTGEAMDNNKLLDRMLYCYHRYLDLFVATAARGEVSFVMFYTLYQSHAIGEVQLRVCENCTGQFIFLRTTHAPTCPICAMHRHARSAAHRHLPLQESAGSPPGRSDV